MYSVIGWIYEVFLEVVVYRWGFSNRGVLFGPYCVIYGFGALILIFSLSWLQKKRIHIEGTDHAAVRLYRYCPDHYYCRADRQLYYGAYPRRMAVGLHPLCFNFEGRIALNPSIRFGIGGMIFYTFCSHLFYKAAENWEKRKYL